MRSFTYAAMVAGAIAADTAVVFNPFVPPSALSLKGTEKDVKTYVNVCPANNNGVTAIPESASATPIASASSLASSARVIQLTPIPSPPSTTAAARLRRADSGVPLVTLDEGALCEPYTLKQGSETYEFHMTDPSPGQWTIDGNCNWKGEMTTADITCTLTQSGIFPENVGVATETYPAKSISMMVAIQSVPLTSAGAEPTASGSATQSGTVAPSGSAAPSGSSSPTPSAGLGAAGPLPTGAMAYVGGAAGILAAALAL